MKNNSILIISNEEEKAQEISLKTKLLRDCDQIRTASYNEAQTTLNTELPSLIILYCNSLSAIELIKDLRQTEILNKIPIIFVMDTFKEDILIQAFDNKIDDFFFLNENDSVILMRIFIALQKSTLNKQIEINNQILTAGEFIDKYTDIYTKEKAPIVLRIFIGRCLEANIQDSLFMYLRPIPHKKKLDKIKICKILKRTLRADDIIAYGEESGFYILLNNIEEANVESILKRIRALLKDECTIYANGAKITASFEEMETILLKNMEHQLEEDIEYSFIKDTYIQSYKESFKIEDETGKSFKDFKKEFFESFEKITAPVFYQVKTKNEEIYPNFKFKYEIKQDKFVFSIEEGEFKKELTISYPAYLNLIIEIKDEESQNVVNVSRNVIEFEDFSEETLSEILENMINSFSDKVKENKIINIE